MGPVGVDFVSSEWESFCGDFGARFLRMVTFLMRLVSHSLFGTSSLSKGSLLFRNVLSEPLTSENGSFILLVGVTSLLSLSKASPNPRVSRGVLRLSPSGVLVRLASTDEKGSSLAVLKDSALDEGCVNKLGRSRNAMGSVVLGGLGSGVGGLRWLTGVLNEGFFDIKDDTTPSAYGGALKLVADSWS